MNALHSSAPLFLFIFLSITISPVFAAAPVADFYAMPESGDAPLTVNFMDMSSGSPFPTGWAWFFGDETYAQEWTEVNTVSGWTPRQHHSSVAMPDGSIVLMGGSDDSGYLNDTWLSADGGATWTELNPSAGWSARAGFSSVAMPDGSIVLMGGYDGSGNQNDVWNSSDNGATWALVNASAGWTPREGHRSVAMPDGSIVLMGGSSESGFLNDTWLSADNGATWSEVTASAGWSARFGQSSVAMPDGSIVLMGGYDTSNLNDVWNSTDNGATWNQVNASAGWSARYGHSSVAMPDGSIILMGGEGDSGYLNDVWLSSDDGATWNAVSASAGWMGRFGQSSVAMPDGSIVLMGGRDLNDVWVSADNGATWDEMKASSVWTPQRGSQSSVAMPGGSIVLMGGTLGEGGYRNDTWLSEDYGATWDQVNGSSGWSRRCCHRSVAMPDDSIVLMGGAGNSGYLNDTWLSTDGGATWTELNPSAGWSARTAFSSVAMPDGSIVLMGGYDTSNLNDVWQSIDNGVTWDMVNASAEWTPRAGQTSVAMPDGSIVLMGGSDDSGYLNDTWLSTDGGATWTELNPSAGWSARTSFSSVAMPDGSIVLMGGSDDSSSYLNDTWLSTDGGATWTELNPSARWSARTSFSSVAMPDGSIVLMGGAGVYGYLTDVWQLNPTGSSLQYPSHTYTIPGTYQVSLQAYNTDGYSSMRIPGYIDVSAVVFNGTVIDQYATLYIGEQGLNVTHALNQAQGSPPDGIPANTTIGWWASGTPGGPPSNYIGLNGRYTSLTVEPLDFVGYTGSWYVLEADETTPMGLAFSVQDPALDIRVWDYTTDSDVTGMSVPQGSLLGFRIDTNMDGSVNYRTPLNPATDGFIDIRVINESGTTFEALYHYSTDEGALAGPGSLLANYVDVQPWFWGSPSLAWNTSARDSGAYLYPAGTYTVMANSTLHNMTDNYKSGGADYLGKTVSLPYTITIVPGSTALPVASFTGAPVNGAAPLDVRFNDTSDAAGPLMWNWSFGDTAWFNTTDSAARNASYIYTIPGTYDVSLTVTNASGSDTATFAGYITVTPPLSETVTVGADQNSVTGISPFSVTISGLPGTAYHLWVNGTSSMTGGYDDQPPMISPGQAGVMFDSYDLAAPYRVDIHPLNGGYVFQNGAGKTIWEDVAHGTCTGTDCGTLDNRGFLGNGTRLYALVTTNSFGTRTVQFETTSWTGAQTYLVRVERYDGSYINDEVAVTVETGAPLSASFTASPVSGTAPLAVRFTDTSDVVSPLMWNWSFGDGTWFVTTNSAARNPDHRYATGGNYVASLTVTNASGRYTATLPGYITVGGTSGLPASGFTASITSGTAPLSVRFTDTSNVAGPLMWNWSFGDGTWFNTTDSAARNPVHLYLTEGTYTVSLTVTNALGRYTMLGEVPITVTPGGGGGGGYASSDDAPPAPAAAAPLPAVQPPALPPVQPPGIPVITEQGVSMSYLVGFPGLIYNENDKDMLVINLAGAKSAGASVTQYFDRVEVYQHNSPGVLMTFWGDRFDIINGNLTGRVKRAELLTDPLNATLQQPGTVSGSVRAALPALLQPGRIINTLSENVSAGSLAQFEETAKKNDLSLIRVAFTFTVRRVNLTTGAANVTLSLPASWVNAHGSRDAVRIARISDDPGRNELLTTTYLGTDDPGILTFRGSSPNGTSLFGLFTAEATAAKKEEQPNITYIPISKPAMVTNVGMFGWLAENLMANPLLIVVVIALLLAALYFGWWKRRLR